jgi:hypothetical protein
MLWYVRLAFGCQMPVEFEKSLSNTRTLFSYPCDAAKVKPGSSVDLLPISEKIALCTIKDEVKLSELLISG